MSKIKTWVGFMGKSWLVIVWLLVILSTTALPSLAATITVDDDLKDYPDTDFVRVIDALSAANDGDTILVYPGEYVQECFTIEKNIILRGINKPLLGSSDIIVARVIEIKADGCQIEGFRIKASGTGISVSSNNNTITDNEITAQGTFGSGIIIDKDDNRIISNNISAYSRGIDVGGRNNEILKNNIRGRYAPLSIGIDIEGSANKIIENTITNFGFHGIDIGLYGEDNIVFANSIENCEDGFYLDGDRNFISYNYVEFSDYPVYTTDGSSKSLSEKYKNKNTDSKKG